MKWSVVTRSSGPTSWFPLRSIAALRSSNNATSSSPRRVVYEVVGGIGTSPCLIGAMRRSSLLFRRCRLLGGGRVGIGRPRDGRDVQGGVAGDARSGGRLLNESSAALAARSPAARFSIRCAFEKN